MGQWLHTLAALRSRLCGQRKPRLVIGSRWPFDLWPVAIPIDTLNTHFYIVGQTGKGKSSYLLSLAQQLIEAGEGVGVIDPHGDLVHDLLAILDTCPKASPWLAHPAQRRRVIYLDVKSTWRVPFNPLAVRTLPPYLIAQSVIEAFRRTWPEELAAAPRFANLALHSLLVLIANRLSLLELPRLLTNPAYRAQLLTNVTDPKVLDFFQDRFDRWGRETPLMIESLLNKSTALTLNPYLAPMLGADRCLSLRAVMDEGKILLVNLCTPEGETRNLFGSLLMTAFEQAALSRENLPKAKRRRFFLIVDEFQKFTATEGSVTTLAEMLSECRKYGLHLIFAHQSWAQLSTHSRLVGALEQAQVKAIFGTGRDTAETIVKEVFLPNPQAVKHQVRDETAQERSHPLYNPLLEQVEMATQWIQRLKKRRVLVKLPEQERLFSLYTPTVPHPQLTPVQLAAMKDELAKQEGRPHQALEAAISARAALDGMQTKIAPLPPATHPQENAYWDP